MVALSWDFYSNHPMRMTSRRYSLQWFTLKVPSALQTHRNTLTLSGIKVKTPMTSPFIASGIHQFHFSFSSTLRDRSPHVYCYPAIKVWLKCHFLLEKEQLQSIKKILHSRMHLSPLTLTTTMAGRCFYTHFVGEEKGSKGPRGHS